MLKDKLIVALDFPTQEEAIKLVDTLGDSVSFYKVGMELFYSSGTDIIKELKKRNKQVFLDLKLHDIPNTVAQSLKTLVRLGVDLMTIHGSGGFSMMQAAMKAVHSEADKLGIPAPKVIAVTVLTSISPMEWEELGFSNSISEQACHIACIAKKAGVDGVVSSPEEARFIRSDIQRLADAGMTDNTEFLVVTPGVRLGTEGADDQSRVALPSQALKSGASHLVVGRPIRAAADPLKAAQEILAEMENAQC